MKPSPRRLSLVTVRALVGVARAGRASNQAAAQTGRTLQFENEEVKVWKSVILPASPLPLHRHEHPRVLIALVGGKMRIVEQDGTSETHEWQTGQSYWLPANPPGTLHSDVNGCHMNGARRCEDRE